MQNESHKIHREAKNNKESSIEIKIMLITFFDSKGTHKEFVPTGQTITGEPSSRIGATL